MRFYEIYLITNTINNKKYVGQTRSDVGYLKRFKIHCYEAKHGNRLSVLHKAILKYGEENFKIKRLLKNIPESDIDFYECLWIKKLNTHVLNNAGYNVTDGGQGVHGYHHTDESRAKMSAAAKHLWSDLKENNLDEYNRLCEIRRNNMKNRPKSEIHKKHISEAAKKRFEDSPGTFAGKHHSIEAKAKISEANGSAVVMIDKETLESIKTFVSAAEATRWLIENGKTKNIYANARILRICNGDDKSAYGYYWKYLKEV